MQKSGEVRLLRYQPWGTPHQLRLVLLGLACVLLWMTKVSDAQSTAGGSFYVSPTGDDSNSGSLARPWRTITHAVLSTHAGDTIFLRGGTYQETEIWIRDSRQMGGSPGNFKTIQNYYGEQPVLQNQNGINLSASWIRIQGIQFQGVGVSSNTWDGTVPDNIQIIGNSFYGATPGAAIDLVGDHLLVNKNWIAMKSQPSNADSGIALRYGQNNVISGNYISGTTGPGLYIHDENLSVYPAGAATSGYNNVMIAGNIIKGSVMSSGLVLSTGSNFAVQNVIINNNVSSGNYVNGFDIETGLGVKIFNNTIYGNGADGILVVYPAPSYQMKDVEIENNILDDPCTQSCSSHRHVAVTNTGMSGLVLMDNLYWPQSIGSTNAVDSRPLFADPMFTNAAAGDFTLQVGSPAIDAGVDVGLPFNGSAPDLGAFESTATTAPQNQLLVRTALDQTQNTKQSSTATGSYQVIKGNSKHSNLTVSAGSNQTITLPSAATLTASVTGVPAGTTAMITWSMTSGPGTVTFANANALSTTATFSTAGTYVLTVNATASGLTATSSVTITVNAALLTATLAWDPETDPNLAGYNVYRSTQSGVFTSGPLNGPMLLTSSYSDSTVKSGQTYYYVVRAVNTSGVEGPSSNQVQFPAAPVPTTSLVNQTPTGSATASPVAMAWNPNTESYLAGYNIYRSNQAGVFTSAPLNGSQLLAVPSFTDSSVQIGNTYYYVVTAVSTSGMESPNSNAIQVTR